MSDGPDGLGFFGLGFANIFLALDPTTGDGTPKWVMWALLVLTGIALAADGVISAALLARRRYLGWESRSD